MNEEEGITMIHNPFDYTNAVIDSEELTSSEKIVALVIARHFNWIDENPAFPTVETLAKKSGVSEKTVKRATKSLEQKGWLSKERRFNMSNLYTPSIPNRVTMTSSKPNGVTVSPQWGHDDTSNGVTSSLLTNKLTNNITKKIETLESEENSSSNIININKYLNPEVSLDNIKEEVSDKSIYLDIIKERKTRGIF